MSLYVFASLKLATLTAAFKTDGGKVFSLSLKIVGTTTRATKLCAARNTFRACAPIYREGHIIGVATQNASKNSRPQMMKVFLRR
jgi:hypothetical protein